MDGVDEPFLAKQVLKKSDTHGFKTLKKYNMRAIKSANLNNLEIEAYIS